MGELEAIRGYEEREAQEGIHIHRCPRYGESVTPCCGKTPFEIPGWHRMTVKPELVNCGRLELEAEVERLRGVVGLLREARAWWPRDPHSPHVPRMNPAAPFLEAIDTALAALELKP